MSLRPSVDKIAASSGPATASANVTALQSAVGKSSPASHARRKRIRKQIKIILDQRVPFKLIEETFGGLPIRVALIDPSVANLHGLPSRIEAREKHEQNRLIGIEAMRNAAPIFQRVFGDPEAPIWNSAKTDTPSGPSHSSSKQNALGSPEPAAAATPVSRPAEPAHLHQPQTQPQSTPLVAKTEGAQQASEAVSNKLPAQSPSGQAGVDESSPVPPSKKADPPQPILPISPSSLEPQEDILEVINSLSWDDTKHRDPPKADVDAPKAKQDTSVSAPEPSSQPAVAGRKTRLSVNERGAAMNKVAAAVVARQVHERAAVPRKAQPTQLSPSADARATNTQPVVNPHGLELQRLQAEVVQDILARRTLVYRDRYGRVRINDARTEDPAMAAWVIDPQMQPELERQLEHQEHQLKGICQYILHLTLHLNGQSHEPGYKGQKGSEASQLLADWEHNSTVRDGLRYLAERSYQVPQRDIPETTDLFSAVLSGSDEARNEVSRRYHAHCVALNIEPASPDDALAASKAQERSHNGATKQVQLSTALKPGASSDRAAEAPQIGPAHQIPGANSRSDTPE